MDVLFTKCSKAIEHANKTRGIGCFYSEINDANENIHIHECCEILFCISGGKAFFIDDRIYDVDDGDIFVLNQFEAHKITYSGKGDFKRYVMQIHPGFLFDASTSKTDLSACFSIRGDNISHKISLSDDEQTKMLHIFNKLSLNSDFGDDILKNIAAIEFIANVNKLFFEKNREYNYHLDYENKTIVSALKFINENFSKPLSLEIVAKNCFISVNELCRLFRNHIGTTVTKYIVSKRISEAKKLLQKGESVSSTAEKCGFMDYASFIRTFKKSVGVPPGKYKKNGISI